MQEINNFKVSIIMNCYNGEKFLKESINSVINQTFKNWEIIFFDNFSNDNSVSIVKAFNDERIKIHKSKTFLNLYNARNEALSKAKGKYIFFLDTDDYWKNNKIEQQVEFLEQNNEYVMVYSNFYIKDDKKNSENISFKFDLPQGMITKKILKKYTIGILTACIKRNIFEKIKFNENLNIIGDFDFFLNLSIKYKIGCIQEPLAYYRKHDENFSKKNIKMHIKELNLWIKKNKTKFNNLGYSLFYQKIVLSKLRLKYYLSILGV